MISEIIIDENKYDYRELIPKEFFDINKEKYIIIGTKSKNEPLGILICELIDKNGVILFSKIDKSVHSRYEEITNSLFQALERLLFEKGIQYVFCFHNEKIKDNYFKEVLESREWLTSEDQYEYLMNPKKITMSSVPPKLDKKFQLLNLGKMNIDNLELLINQINKTVNSSELIPSLELIDLSKSYFLIYENKAVGWFIVNKNEDELEEKLLLSRFYVINKFREFKVSNSFVKYAMYQVYSSYKYKYLALNVLKNDSKLNDIIKKGFLGKVEEKKTILRSFKKLNK
ncbi:hypothetical protein CLOBY_33240 [Clostridium saccharobutylicum]|uniref:hypothetical protein n=1 Tax=Clostridium saccharobutylicum TaxID=169679 RepID=UPI000983E41B|nr:hypothetical protein [Clostridium saccharobutylicum]AQS11170.1 hypothetical protein CLOBY_33240 [Clostridium saccharobutylicum]MBC2437447.1 hypothetical protein [Clostridium saccharobutylicum]NSB89761.1 hypothetical protein [Clostridium saccharobutylicum]NYC32174.1 hypothetical protein [Clostridium saccharobutylicum]OOM16969.1 hypothetical protein CLSAB_21750 [Clostridium saccharobutylicum]